jgi:uncharacterized membrane protein HdeD (DUF308 family)
MSFSFKPNLRDLTTYAGFSKWFFLWGAALLILGILAIAFTTFTTLLSVYLLGCIILASGIVIILDTFVFWRGKSSGFWLTLGMAILYILAGSTILYNPIFAAAYLTLLLGALYFALGFFRLFYSVSLRTPHSSWNLFNGLISLLLGALILAQWPASGLYIIGLFIGIDLIFAGWTYLMIGFAARR